MNCSSKIPKRYRHNTIFGEFHRAVRISTNIIHKFRKADYSNIVNGFLKSTNDLEDLYIIPPNLFGIQKSFILTEITFSERNENKLKEFIRKFHEFTNNKFKISMKWITIIGKNWKQYFLP